MAKPNTNFVAERLSLAIEPGSIDREKGIVKNVRLVGPESPSWKRRYGTVFERDAGKLAVGVNVDHHFDFATGQPKHVPTTAKFGRILNPRHHAGGGNGDLKYNPEHPFAKPFLWACENDPESYSFSPVMEVTWKPGRDKDGFLVAESIRTVLSVDIVDRGGTTNSIFEAENPNPMDAPSGTDVASSLETDGAWIAFLTDLFAQAKSLAQPTKDTILALVTASLAGSAEPPPESTDGSTDPAMAAPAMEMLRRMGKVGKWAAGKLDSLFVAESAKKRATWAENLIKVEAVPESLVTPLFTTLVAECMGNEARAKELIADRKKLTGGSGGSGGTGGAPRTSPVNGGGKVSIKDIVDGYTAG